MKLKKIFLPLLLSIAVSGCSTSSVLPSSPSRTKKRTAPVINESVEEKPETEEQFKKLLNDYVIDTCEASYITAHNYFEDPQAHGIEIKPESITLGEFVTDEDDVKESEDFLDQLDKIDPSELSDTYQDIYQQLYWQTSLDVASSNPDFEYISNIWTEDSGVQTNLVTFFSEYELFSVNDIDYLIQLIEDTPSYIDKALDYSEEQAKRGLLRIDLDTVNQGCDDVINSKDHSAVESELNLEIDSLMLSEEETQTWKTKVKNALDESFYPSFSKIKEGLDELKSDIKPIVGLGMLDHGDEYYSLLLEYYTGLDMDYADYQESVFNHLNELAEEYNALGETNPEATYGDEVLATSFTDINQFLPFLAEHYTSEFPAVDEMDYEIQPLSNEQSSTGIVAYFLVPPIGSSKIYQIRYNERDYGSDPSDPELFDTFAHEGIPGHMYQTQYNKQHFVNDAQYLQDSMGFQEGYANYAASKALSWLDLDQDLLLAWQLSEEYSNFLILLMDLQVNGLGLSKKEFISQYGDELGSLYDSLAQRPAIFFSYYFSSYQLTQIEEKAKEALGSDFDEVEFNNAILQAGSVKFSIVEKNVDKWVDLKKNGV